MCGKALLLLKKYTIFNFHQMVCLRVNFREVLKRNYSATMHYTSMIVPLYF